MKQCLLCLAGLMPNKLMISDFSNLQLNFNYPDQGSIEIFPGEIMAFSFFRNVCSTNGTTAGHLGCLSE